MVVSKSPSKIGDEPDLFTKFSGTSVLSGPFTGTAPRMTASDGGLSQASINRLGTLPEESSLRVGHTADHEPDRVG